MPPLTLHVLPPAFALPSISHDCIAAIAYLHYTQRYGTWIVVADAAEYPNRNAPFLTPAYHHLEPTPSLVEGLDAIIHHLIKANSTIQLGSALKPDDQAHAVALASHLETRLGPLVALSLYACSENYSSAVRPSFAKILPFPESWTLPNHLHSIALQSCSHLDVDVKHLSLLSEVVRMSKGNGSTNPGLANEDDAIPNIGLNKKQNPTIAASIKVKQRIDALVYSALAPFSAVLRLSSKSLPPENDAGTKVQWSFGSTGPTRTDIIALSLLSLAILPYGVDKTNAASNEDAGLAIPFLSESIGRQFPTLVPDYLLPALEDTFAGKTSLEAALIEAPLGTSAEDEDEDDGAFGCATSGYDNLDIGSGKVGIPWRRKRTGSSWDGASRIGSAIGAVFGEALGMR